MPKAFLKRYMPDRHKISEIKALNFLGEKLHRPNLWHLNRRSVSRAFAIGFWAMYTPPLPWQQILAAALAIYFNANLPVAVALVWITNPLTWAPMYYVAYWVGTLIMGQSSFGFNEFSASFTIEKVWELGAPFLVGCFTLMNLGGLIGYFGIQYLWRKSAIHHWELRKVRRTGLNTKILVSETYRSYQNLLRHHAEHQAKKTRTEIPETDQGSVS
ncbi:MAG: DUF2062 domain-containing protein [Methylotetracoccus sp.]|jgi:hypothetical protein|nr:DUF2062 domain-containing protein [Methylotetracoccus sp.]